MPDLTPNQSVQQQPPASPAGVPPASGGAGQQQPGQSAGASQFPWQSEERFRDKSPEDIWSNYREAETKIGKLSERAKVADVVDQMGGVDNVRAWLAWAQDQYSRAQQQPQQAQQPQQQQPNAAEAQQALSRAFENWDLMTPTEQAQRLYGVLAQAVGGYVNNLAAQYAQQFQQANQEYQQNIARQWDIYRQAMRLKLQHPELDEEALLTRAAQVASGNINDLLQIAYQGMTGNQMVEKQIQDAVAQARADWELKQRNGQMQAVPPTGRAPYKTPQAPGATKSDENAFIMSKLLQQGIVNPGQL